MKRVGKQVSQKNHKRIKREMDGEFNRVELAWSSDLQMYLQAQEECDNEKDGFYYCLF